MHLHHQHSASHKLAIYIKAMMLHSTSVLMAEAAALALAAEIATALHLSQVTFLSDNQQLVSFFNSSDHSNPPLWETKPLTQKFINCRSQLQAKVFKISRELNTTSHILASQALNDCNSQECTVNITCSNCNHVNASQLGKR